MTHATSEIRRISAIDVATLDDLLNSAIEDAIPNALVLNRGIRVTRAGPGEYLVETAAVQSAWIEALPEPLWPGSVLLISPDHRQVMPGAPWPDTYFLRAADCLAWAPHDGRPTVLQAPSAVQPGNRSI